MRDTLKPKDHFDGFLSKNTRRLGMFRDALKAPVSFKRDFGLFNNLVKTPWKIASAMYSRGDSIEDVQAMYLEGAAAIANVNTKRAEDPEYVKKGYVSYNNQMQDLALAILYQPAPAILAEIFDRVVFFDTADEILNAMIRHLGFTGDFRHDPDVSWPEMKELHNAIFVEPIDRAGALRRYVEGWYKNNSDAGWYNNHKSKNDTYFGYWSWEAAAVAVMMDIDDSDLRDHPHYPSDLADWARARK